MSSSAITGPILSDNKRAPAGTAAAPSFAFNDSTGTGVYLVSAGVLGLSTAGVQRVVVDASGNVGINTALYTADSLGHGGNNKSINVYNSNTVVNSQAHITLQSNASSVADSSIGSVSWGLPNITATNKGLALIAANTEADHTSANPSSRLTFYTRKASDNQWNERMRLTSDGKLSIGDTGAIGNEASKIAIKSTSNINSAISFTDVVGGGKVWLMGPGVGFGTTTDFGFYNWTNTNIIGRFTSTGYWFQGNNSSSWSIVSDARIKENVRPVNDCLSKIVNLNPVHFEYIDKLGQIKTGFIAQEFEQVLPGHVLESSCPQSISELKPELKGEKIKSIDADLIPYLVGAIKEQQAMIETLKAEVAALKAP